MLDDDGWFAPFVETWNSEKLHWAETPARHSFAKVPDLAVFDALIRDYAAEGARP